jgi:Helix-turn-helix domain
MSEALTRIKLRRHCCVSVSMRQSSLSPTLGRTFGITTAHQRVLHALLWHFMIYRDGLCFPSYETIAEKARCCRDTVYEAIMALEEAGIFSWRNVYEFRDLLPTGQEIQELPSELSLNLGDGRGQAAAV